MWQGITANDLRKILLVDTDSGCKLAEAPRGHLKDRNSREAIPTRPVTKISFPNERHQRLRWRRWFLVRGLRCLARKTTSSMHSRLCRRYACPPALQLESVCPRETSDASVHAFVQGHKACCSDCPRCLAHLQPRAPCVAFSTL